LQKNNIFSAFPTVGLITLSASDAQVISLQSMLSKDYILYRYNLYKEMELTKNTKQKTPVGGSCDEDEGRKGTHESTERIQRREKTSWKARVRWRDAVDRHATKMSKCKNC
jgi:hypothetical protein